MQENCLTEKSEQIIDFIHQNKLILDEKILKNVPPDEVDQLIKNLKTMLDNVEKLKEEKDVS